jgi:hypothetical protein
MGQRGCMVAVLVEEPPEFEFDGWLFYVCDAKTGTCRAYRPETFFRTFARMAEIGREWRIEQSGKVERIDQWRDSLPSFPAEVHAASS